jgi:exonuclease SbcC
VAKIEKDIQAAQAAVDQADKALSARGTLGNAVIEASKQLQTTYYRAQEQVSECSKQLKDARLEGTDDVELLQGRAVEYQAKKDDLAAANTALKDANATISAETKELENLEKREASGVTLPPGVKASSGSVDDLELDDAETGFDEALASFKKADTLLAAATKRLKQEEIDHKEALAALERKIEKSGFRNVKALREAQLPAKEVERIAKAKEAIDKRINESSLLLKEAEVQLTKLVKEGIPRGTAAEKVKGRHSELVQSLDEIATAVTSRRGELAKDEDNQKKQKQLFSEIQREMEEVIVWRRLRELIGSKDGAKFRRFAQSITLQILTSHANKHLGRLNDRYALLLQEGDTLGLQIEDYYQAGIKRPLASLSGGESFLASLALALGLSDLAGRSVNIDTLFIDEGFGTLDPETLEVALTALETLRQGNKSVGVISHVGLLKERITTQIVVNKGPSGFSTLKVVS